MAASRLEDASTHQQVRLVILRYYLIHYYRHPGPTTIAASHEKISLKARHDYRGKARHPSMFSSSLIHQGGLLLFFDSPGMPVAAFIPDY